MEQEDKIMPEVSDLKSSIEAVNWDTSENPMQDVTTVLDSLAKKDAAWMQSVRSSPAGATALESVYDQTGKHCDKAVDSMANMAKDISEKKVTLEDVEKKRAEVDVFLEKAEMAARLHEKTMLGIGRAKERLTTHVATCTARGEWATLVQKVDAASFCSTITAADMKKKQFCETLQVKVKAVTVKAQELVQNKAVSAREEQAVAEVLKHGLDSGGAV